MTVRSFGGKTGPGTLVLVLFNQFHYILQRIKCLILAWTYCIPVGFGCFGPGPFGLQCGKVSSSWQCCNSKAGCSLQCGRSLRWSLLGTGAAGMRCRAASTPAERSHWDRKKWVEARTQQVQIGRKKKGEEKEDRRDCGLKKKKSVFWKKSILAHWHIIV